jgi:hypothetical protein
VEARELLRENVWKRDELMPKLKLGPTYEIVVLRT